MGENKSEQRALSETANVQEGIFLVRLLLVSTNVGTWSLVGPMLKGLHKRGLTKHRQCSDNQHLGGEDMALSRRWMSLFTYSNDQRHTKKMEPRGCQEGFFKKN